ncbi:MAG: DUF1559 domain-containing protein [bacterium]
MLNARMHYGITAIEAVVIVVIIFAVVLYLWFPMHGDREPARQTQCTNNQKQLTTAFQIYVQEHHDTLPGINWVSDIEGEKVDGRIYLCPEVKADTSPGKSLPICYGYNGLLIKDDGTGMKWDSTDKAIDPSVIPLTADVEPVGTLTVPPIMYNTHGRNGAVATPVLRHRNGAVIYSFLDGHIEVSKTLLQPRGLPVVVPAGVGG